MKFFLPNTLSFVSTNVAENEAEDGTSYATYSVTSGYNTGAIVKFGENIYEALTTIYPLAHYLWEDNIVTDKHAVALHTQTEYYPVAGQILLPIVNNATVVYVRSVGKWFLAKTTATIDFMAESLTTPANFNEIVAPPPIPYRYEYNYPVGSDDTLFWGYNGVANKYRALDRAIGTQTSKYGASLTMSLSAIACNTLSLFNVYAQTVNVTVWDVGDPLLPIQLYTTTLTMTDTSALDTYEKVCTLPVPLNPTTTVFFQTRYAQQIDLVFSGVPTPAVGAIKAGMLDYLGETLDGVDVGIKSYNIVERRANGELVWNKNNNETNKVNTLRYNVKMSTPTFDAAASKLKTITDKEVVLLGDDADVAGYRTLHSYGAIKSASALLRTNDTKSTASIEIENFV